MKNIQKKKEEQRKARIRRTRSKIFGSAQRPRACVNRTLKHIYVQLIDDAKGKTLIAVSLSLIHI